MYIKKYQVLCNGMGDEMINYLPDDEQQNDEKVQKEHKKCK